MSESTAAVHTIRVDQYFLGCVKAYLQVVLNDETEDQQKHFDLLPGNHGFPLSTQ